MRFQPAVYSKIQGEQLVAQTAENQIDCVTFHLIAKMQRIVPCKEASYVLSSDLELICKAILDASWKVSGCGLGHGALSCALFFAEYAASSGQADLNGEIEQLFERGCNSVASGRTCWLDFADLALVAQRLARLGLIQMESHHFFEDIDKLAVSVLKNPCRIGGFENSDLGAALYGLRRLSAGAAHFSAPIKQFASALTSRNEASLLGTSSSENLRFGASASVLLVAALSDRSLIGKNIETSVLAILVEGLYEHVNSLTNAQTDPGFQTGELGIGYAVLRAGMCFHKDEWITRGLQILIDCAYLTLRRGIGTLDMASGAAGIAFAFNKLYRLSGYDIFRSAAAKARWLTLKAGVMADQCNIDQGYSFYYGLPGIGLSTLYAQLNRPEELDELLWLL